jgi:hypothetical protein
MVERARSAGLPVPILAAIVAAGFLLWTIESILEGKPIPEALAGPVLVCGWLGTIFVLDRWVRWRSSRQSG